ncbi:MAG: hypothetical protein J6V09_01995 [Clostridia bacterium]|nr:hypothetical protein [Clostridia bacterium]
MNKSSVFSIIFNLCAIVLFLAGIITFSREASTTLGTTFVSGGFTFLMLGIYLSRRSRNGK